MISTRRTVTAAEMGRAVDHDPQMHLPTHPLLVRGLVFIPFQHGMIVDGTSEPQVFRGQGVQTFLSRLLPLLNGANALADLVQHLPEIPEEALRDAIALLYSRGLLEEGEQARDPAWCANFPHVANFFHRHIDTTRVHVNAGEALKALGEHRVLVVGRDALCEGIGEELAKCGMMDVRFVPQLSQKGSRGWDLVVGAGEPDNEMHRIDTICHGSGTPWLRVGIYGTRIEIGPRFGCDAQLCFRCFAQRCEPYGGPAVVAEHVRAMAVGLIATEVVMLASRLGELATGSSMLVFEEREWSLTRVHPVPVAGCGICAMGDVDGAGFRYESALTPISKKLTSPKMHQLHHRKVQQELQRSQPRYLRQPVHALPGSAIYGCENVAYRGALLLGALLRLGGGMRAEGTPSSPPRRWSPSAGNLGSVQMYLIPFGSCGLKPAVYYYDNARDALVEIAAEAVAEGVDKLLRPGTRGDDGPGAWFVLTAALGRLRAKYGPLGLRLAHLDAGVALAQMEIAAYESGARWAATDEWPDEAIRKELNLIGEVEPVTAVASVWLTPEIGGSCP